MFRTVAVPPLTPEEDRRRVRRQLRVMGGLLLTLAGLLFSVALLPDASGKLVATLPVLAVSLVAVWTGGILLGGSGAGRRAPR